MTVHNRLGAAHRQLKARQGRETKTKDNIFSGLFPPRPATTTSAEETQQDPAPTPTPPSSSPRGNDPTPTPPTTSRTRHRDDPTPTPTTSSTKPAEPTSTSVKPETTSSSEVVPVTTSSIASIPTTSTLSSVSLKIASTGPITITGVAVTQTRTSFSGTLTPSATSDDSLNTVSSTPAPTSGMSTGAIIGSVAGGLAGLVAICIIVAFILRRLRRNRVTDDDFNPAEFVRSPNMSETGGGGGGYGADPFEPTPPSAAFRGHNIAPSISSGLNMAGQGAYAYGGSPAVQDDQAYAHGAYGHDEAFEAAHGGAYSSEPQPQQAYNPEAYGAYAYTDGPTAVSYQQYPYQDHLAGPALVAGAPAVAAGRATPINNEDAYGGF